MELDSYASPDAEALIAVPEERLSRSDRQTRELITTTVSAAAFMAAALSLAVLAPWKQHFSIEALALVLLVWVAVERVKFPVAGGWTHPTMLAFIPALFLLPTPLVPVVAAIGTVLRRAPDLLRGRVPLALLPVPIADVWFAMGAALVIVVTETEEFSWSHWGAYAAALFAVFAFDVGATMTSSWIAEGISPRVQLPLLTWLYVVDLALAPLGLLIAAAAVDHRGLVLLALSPMAMLWLFARERKERMDETLALSTAYRGTALLLGDVVEADDHYTGTHSRDVVELAVGVAERLGLDSTQKRDVEFAALLHDVGKIHVPKEIINKPGPLNDEEWAVMHRHTIEGERMLKQVGGLLARVGTIVRASHERWDGGGYPDGTAGAEIPIEARIVSTCDAFSAMTTDRSYRKAMTVEQALAELRRCAGTQFDPVVVGAIEASFAPTLHERPQPDSGPWRVPGLPKLPAPAVTAAVSAGAPAQELVG